MTGRHEATMKRRLGFRTSRETEEAMEQARRQSQYSNIYDFMRHQTSGCGCVFKDEAKKVGAAIEKGAEAAHELLTPHEAEEGKKVIEEAIKRHEEGTEEDNPLHHSPPVYPRCEGRSGMGKVRCLVGAIMADRAISRGRKLKRLRYLIPLNVRAHWASESEVKEIVERAAARVR